MKLAGHFFGITFSWVNLKLKNWEWLRSKAQKELKIKVWFLFFELEVVLLTSQSSSHQLLWQDEIERASAELCQFLVPEFAYSDSQEKRIRKTISRGQPFGSFPYKCVASHLCEVSFSFLSKNLCLVSGCGNQSKVWFHRFCL